VLCVVRLSGVVSLGGSTAKRGYWPPSKSVGSTMTDIGFKNSSLYCCHVYAAKPKLMYCWGLVPTIIDVHSDSCINLRIHSRITSYYLRYRNAGVGDTNKE
jgi:hypothetical protein